MGPNRIISTDMGYIFEELIKKFSESYDEGAGSHFTSRDIIYLMTDLLIAEEKDVLIDEGVAKTVYDQTMGTSQMLSNGRTIKRTGCQGRCYYFWTGN